MWYSCLSFLLIVAERKVCMCNLHVCTLCCEIVWIMHRIKLILHPLLLLLQWVDKCKPAKWISIEDFFPFFLVHSFDFFRTIFCCRISFFLALVRTSRLQSRAAIIIIFAMTIWSRMQNKCDRQKSVYTQNCLWSGHVGVMATAKSEIDTRRKRHTRQTHPHKQSTCDAIVCQLIDCCWCRFWLNFPRKPQSILIKLKHTARRRQTNEKNVTKRRSIHWVIDE